MKPLFTLLLLSAPVWAAGPESKPIAIPPPKSVKECNSLDLFAALDSNQITCFESALKHMDINETNLEGDTPLHMAIRKKNKYAIPFLIQQGADLNRRNHDGQTPLDLSDAYGFQPLSHYLRSLELETDRLLRAVERNDLAAVHASLLRGVAIGLTDIRRDSILHRAVQSNLPEVAALLLRYRASVKARNYLGETPLHSAALRDFFPVMKLLLEAGADPSALNHRRETPLDLASRQMEPKILALLQKYRARPGSRADVSLEMSGGDGEGVDAKAQ